MHIQQTETETAMNNIDKMPATTEVKLIKMKRLNTKIKELQAEYSMMKDEVIAEYFKEHAEYKNNKGLVLATYNVHTRSVFNSDKFKSDHQDIYDLYKENKVTYTFNLK